MLKDHLIRSSDKNCHRRSILNV